MEKERNKQRTKAITLGCRNKTKETVEEKRYRNENARMERKKLRNLRMEEQNQLKREQIKYTVVHYVN